MATPKSKRTTSPAFQFYPESWFSSSKVSRMSHAERGMYIDLLARCWLDNGLPKDERQLAALMKIPASRFRRIWSGVLHECFVERGGKLVNPRQERERNKQSEFRRRQADNGSKGGRPSRNPTDSERETQTKPTDNPLVISEAPFSKPRALEIETEIETETRSRSSEGKKRLPEFDGQKAFMAFQAAYPANRRKGGRILQELYLTQAHRAGGPDVLMDALVNHKASAQWQGDPNHVPGMDTWLEQEYWLQRYEPAGKPKAKSPWVPLEESLKGRVS